MLSKENCLRFAILAAGVFSYAVFLITFVALILFIGNIPLHFNQLYVIMPKSIDSIIGKFSVTAILINLFYILLFAVQHSIMARSAFKERIMQYIPPALERSFYVLTASVVLLLLMRYWQPMTAVLWQVDSLFLQILIWLLFIAGWGLVLYSSFLINHFELFGLQQAYNAFRQKETTPASFQITGIYKFIRHPLYLGFLLGFWATPSMSSGHFLLALGLTIYIFIGVRYEEWSLVERFGEKYLDYMKNTPQIIPFLKFKK